MSSQTAVSAYPHSQGTRGAGFVVPPGACDCHMHVFSDEAAVVAGAAVVHPAATLADYGQIQRRLGLERHVIVQPSTYGLDNSLMLQSLGAAQGRARGVAVIDGSIGDEELVAMHAAGVRGVRFNLVQHGATSLDMLDRVARRIAPFGWHVQMHLRPEAFAPVAPMLSALGVPVVIDHLARVAERAEHSAAVFDALLELLGTGQGWLKLSGAYLATAGTQPAYLDLDPFVRRLVNEHPDRLVWGTDWPHATERDKPDDADLMDLLPRWIPSAAMRNLVLVRNPEALYDFERITGTTLDQESECLPGPDGRGMQEASHP